MSNRRTAQHIIAFARKQDRLKFKITEITNSQIESTYISQAQISTK